MSTPTIVFKTRKQRVKTQEEISQSIYRLKDYFGRRLEISERTIIQGFSEKFVNDLKIEARDSMREMIRQMMSKLTS